MLETIKETAAFIKAKTSIEPSIGIILGTGLGGLVKEIEIVDEIPYETIPNFPVSTVESHSGKLIFGRLGGKNVVAMQGRFHYYEGYSLQQVTFPVRVMKLLGTSGAVGVYTELQFYTYNSPTNQPPVSIGIIKTDNGGYENGVFYIATKATNANTAPVERMRITSGGYLKQS